MSADDPKTPAPKVHFTSRETVEAMRKEAGFKDKPPPPPEEGGAWARTNPPKRGKPAKPGWYR